MSNDKKQSVQAKLAPYHESKQWEELADEKDGETNAFTHHWLADLWYCVEENANSTEVSNDTSVRQYMGLSKTTALSMIIFVQWKYDIKKVNEIKLKLNR